MSGCIWLLLNLSPSLILYQSSWKAMQCVLGCSEVLKCTKITVHFSIRWSVLVCWLCLINSLSQDAEVSLFFLTSQKQFLQDTFNMMVQLWVSKVRKATLPFWQGVTLKRTLLYCFAFFLTKWIDNCNQKVI